MNHCGISPQYITKDRVNVTILKVIDPSHFVVRETPNLANTSSKAKDFLRAEKALQRFYSCVEFSYYELPLKDTIIVVLYKGKFYRARVIYVLSLTTEFQFKVYLVDYGIECNVKRENTYKIQRDFLNHPFQAVTIELLGIKPISLTMDTTTLRVSYGPVSEWDISASMYIKELQKGMSSAYIEVQGIDDLKIYGKLFICYENSPTKCVNDELISKAYARFNEECWKNIKKIENAIGNPNINGITAASELKTSRNESPEQVLCTANFTETVSYFADIKIKFIHPAGKTAAVTHIGSEILQKEIGPSKEESLKDSEKQAQVIAQKNFKKLLSKRRPSLSENSQTDICSSKIHSADSVISNEIVNLSINEDKTDLNISSPVTHNSSLKYQNAENSKRNLFHESPVQTKSMDSSKTEQKSVSEEEAKLIWEKRFKRLFNMVRPVSSSNTNVDVENSPKSSSELAARLADDSSQLQSSNKAMPETPKNSPLGFAASLADDSSQLQSSNKAMHEIPKNSPPIFAASLADDSSSLQSLNKALHEIVKDSPPRQESETQPIPRITRVILKLQREIRLKQMTELHKSNEFNQCQESSINISSDTSVCDRLCNN